MKESSKQVSEFFEKMLEAKKLEKEAFISLLPDYVWGHVKVIEKEIKGLLFDIVLDMQKESETKSTGPEKVKKIKIDGGELE